MSFVEPEVGFRVYRKVRRPSQDILARLADAPVTAIADAMHGFGVVNAEIRPVYSPMARIFGPAVTVDVTPGDGLMVRAALSILHPGDVLVVNGHGCRERALLGGNVGADLARRGAAGLVVDGAVRDIEEFRSLGLPVMALGSVPRSGTTSAGWGEVNVPIACGSVVVSPGDVVSGSEEGLLVAPTRWAGTIIAALDRQIAQSGPTKPVGQRIVGGESPEAHGISAAESALLGRSGTLFDGAFDDSPLP